MNAKPFCTEEGCERCAVDRQECLKDCLRRLDHHKALNPHGKSKLLLSNEEIMEMDKLYNAYYDALKAALISPEIK